MPDSNKYENLEAVLALIEDYNLLALEKSALISYINKFIRLVQTEIDSKKTLDEKTSGYKFLIGLTDYRSNSQKQYFTYCHYRDSLTHRLQELGSHQ
jgi:hypothetical protein